MYLRAVPYLHAVLTDHIRIRVLQGREDFKTVLNSLPSLRMPSIFAHGHV